MMLTRRDTAKALLAGAVLPLWPMPAFAQNPKDWARAFEAALNQSRDLQFKAVFAVDRLELTQGANHVQMVGDVTLTWAPGKRRRRIEGTGNAPETAFADLLAKARTEFSQACIGHAV